jgi:hypothetical protein
MTGMCPVFAYNSFEPGTFAFGIDTILHEFRPGRSMRPGIPGYVSDNQTPRHHDTNLDTHLLL